MLNFSDFLTIESLSNEELRFKKIYVDICDDFMSGYLLSKILLDFSNSCTYDEKRKCIVRNKTYWWFSARISFDDYERSIEVLTKKNFVERETHFSKLLDTIVVNENEILREINKTMKIIIDYKK